MIITMQVAEPTFNESDTFRYHRTYSTADGCAGLVALEFTSLTGGIESRYLRVRRGIN